MNVIIDTDILLALFNESDINHHKAITLSKRLKRKKINVWVLPTTICEFARVLSYQVKYSNSQQAVLMIQNKITTLEITLSISTCAAQMYQKQTSKKDTLFDCYNMAAAQKYGISYIFSFDRGYKKQHNNFQLVSEIK